MTPFELRLHGDAELRRLFIEHLDGLILSENTLDRIDGTRPLEHQRGVVAVLRRLRTNTAALERPKENQS